MDLELPFLSRAAPGSTSKALEAIDAALSLTVNSWLRKHGKVAACPWPTCCMATAPPAMWAEPGGQGVLAWRGGAGASCEPVTAQASCEGASRRV